MFVPGEALLLELSNEPSGLWFIHADNETSLSVVVKLPTPVLKAILQNAPTFLFAARVTIRQKNIPFVGIRVDDDVKHPQFVVQPFINTTNVPGQTGRFATILQDRRTALHFFNERNRPVLSSACSLEQQQADQAFEVIQPFQANNIEWSESVELAQDLFLQDLDRIFQNEPPQHSEICFIQASLVHAEPTNIIEIHKAETVAGYRLDNTDEGKSQESLVYNTLARVFGDSTFLSPFVNEGAVKRELTDILGFGKGQICLVESKALSMLNVELDRPTPRRASLIAKDIRKGLKQLKGATRFLQRGLDVIDGNGNKVNISLTPSSVVHGIVLVSEMFPFVDWGQVAVDVKEYSNPYELRFLHVMDLADLHRATLLMPDPLRLCLYLRDRFNEVLLHKTALIQPVFVPDNDTKTFFEDRDKTQRQ